MIPRLVVVALLATALAACSGGGNGCVDTVCTPGAKACQADGHLLGTCAADGRTWELASCPDTTYCSAGQCVPTLCAPAQRVCYDPKAWQQCDALGTSLGAQTACADGTACRHGVCLDEPCLAGQSACNGTTVISCGVSGEGWVATECPAGQHCFQPEGQAAACQADLCVPYSRQCAGTEGYQACAADGSGWEAGVACKGGQACHNGICTDKLCALPQPEPDTAGGDTAGDVPAGDATADADALTPLDVPGQADEAGELPPLDVPDSGSAVLNGNQVTFSLSLSGKYVANEKRVIVSMNELVGTLMYQLEVHVIPVEEFTVGEWTSADPSEVACEIRLNDGTGDPGAGADSFKYSAADYQVTLDQFDATGGRLKGTFSGTLKAKDGSTDIVVTNGNFDVKRKN